MLERGGTLGPDDLAAYEPRAPRARAAPPIGAGTCSPTRRPPPGALLIAFALSLLDRAGLGGPGEPSSRRWRRRRLRAPRPSSTASTRTGTHGAFLVRALGSRPPPAGPRRRRPPDPPAEAPGDRLGSTTHITAVDARGALRGGHLLERDRLRRDRSRDRRPRQQHAGRGGPEPAGLPRQPARAAGAVDDVPDRRAPGRRAGGRARQRGLEPHPVGRPADDHPR